MMWTECKAQKDDIVKMRRELHRIPEAGFDLPKTRQYVIEKLETYGIPYVLSDKDSSIIADLKCGKPGKTLALRTDMDALPILEETGAEYASEHDGFMHACGHDAHMAMLLGAAQVLAAHKEELSGTIRFIFQTAEELAKGANIVVENGGLDGVDAIYGMHIGSLFGKEIPTGTIIASEGPLMASFDHFLIKVKGKGSHGSTPEKGVDPVNMAAHIVLALQAISAREINANVANVITIGKIHGGSQYNIIPDEIEIEGTTRALNEKVRRYLSERIEAIAASTAAAFGGSVEYTMDWGAPPVVNDAACAEFAAEAVKEIAGDRLWTQMEAPNMGGEDFAVYQQHVPGAFLYLSSSDAEKGTDIPHHNSKFAIDEDVLWKGSAAYVAIAEKFLK